MTAAARTEKPVLAAGRCVREKHAGARCRACADACPARALSFEGPALRITAPACEGCGACAAACPRDALEFSAPGWRAVLRAIGPSGEAACRCAKAAPGPGVPVPCIGGLSQTERLELLQAGLRTLRMATGVCEGCPSEGRSADGAAFRTRFAEDFGATAAAFGRKVEVVLLTEPVADVDGARRHLLGIVARKSAAPVPLERVGDRSPDAAAGGLLVTAGAGRRLRALRGLCASEPGTDAHAAFGALRVPVFDETKCTACGLCAAACPQHALSARGGAQGNGREEGFFTISAVEAACTGCGLCADICTSKAVAFGAPEAVDAWLSGRPVVKLRAKGLRRASAWEGIVGRSFASGFFRR